jgi:hypothetical protein
MARRDPSGIDVFDVQDLLRTLRTGHGVDASLLGGVVLHGKKYPTDLKEINIFNRPDEGRHSMFDFRIPFESGNNVHYTAYNRSANLSSYPFHHIVTLNAPRTVVNDKPNKVSNYEKVYYDVPLRRVVDNISHLKDLSGSDLSYAATGREGSPIHENKYSKDGDYSEGHNIHDALSNWSRIPFAGHLTQDYSKAVSEMSPEDFKDHVSAMRIPRRAQSLDMMVFKKNKNQYVTGATSDTIPYDIPPNMLSIRNFVHQGDAGGWKVSHHLYDPNTEQLLDTGHFHEE